MYYYDDFQDNMNNENEVRQSEMPYFCPYCQYAIQDAGFEDTYRQPQGRPPQGHHHPSHHRSSKLKLNLFQKPWQWIQVH